MAPRKTARDMEMEAAAKRPPRGRSVRVPAAEAMAMLARRGLQPRTVRLELPFSPDLAGETADRLLALLAHYAFRLFLRGAIQKAGGFAPEDATRYVNRATACKFAEALVDLHIAERVPNGRYRLARPVSSFGPTLEWYLARELDRRLGFDVASGVKFHASGVGGDLDLVAAAEGKLVYLEIKSSPPKHLSEDEVRALFDRVGLLRPDLTLFVMDTALRLSDKVVPILREEIARRRPDTLAAPRRIKRETWAIAPHFYAVNSKPDLVSNVELALAEGFRELAPPLPWIG